MPTKSTTLTAPWPWPWPWPNCPAVPTLGALYGASLVEPKHIAIAPSSSPHDIVGAIQEHRAKWGCDPAIVTWPADPAPTPATQETPERPQEESEP